jgi:peptidoglycan/xylan/chitin deacetylase (PgdA/CDA1 family)
MPNSSWNRIAKALFDRLLTLIGVLIYHAGLGRWIIRLNLTAPKVLMYHACEDLESDFTRGLSINTTPRQFASHLDFLVRHYRVVPLADLLGGTPSEPTVAITVDDGFRSVYENAWPQLRERRLSATCYLTTDVIGNRAMIWLNELNWFFHHQAAVARPIITQWLGLAGGRLTAAAMHSFVERYDPEWIARLLARLRAEAAVDPGELARQSRLHLDWDQVAEMSAAGMAFGNHTGSHPPLANLSRDACRREIRRAAEALAHLPGAGAALAYPFGSRDESTRGIALELGHHALLEVEGVNSPLDPTRIGRIKVSSFSPAVLFARMEVVEPVKAWLKRRLRAAS